MHIEVVFCEDENYG